MAKIIKFKYQGNDIWIDKQQYDFLVNFRKEQTAFHQWAIQNYGFSFPDNIKELYNEHLTKLKNNK